jgi:ribose transport system substrate-binding protein
MVVVCFMAAALVLSGCTTEQPGTAGAATAAGGKVEAKAGDDKYKIGLAMNELVIDFYVAIDTRLQELCDERGWEYVLLDAQGDINQQISNMEDLVSQGCDMILINSFDTEVLTTAINSITESGTPVISIDNSLEESARVLTTVQADNRGISRAVGEWLGDHMGSEEISAVLISGAIGASNSTERRQGMIDGVMEAQLRNNGKTNFKIIAHGYTDWKEEEAVRLMEDMLSLNQDFNVLMTEVDYEAIAAMKVLEDAGKLDGVTVVAAADGDKDALVLIKDGSYGATGLNLPGLISEYTIDVCEQYFGGRTDFPDRVFTPAACIDASNVDEYYDPNALF